MGLLRALPFLACAGAFAPARPAPARLEPLNVHRPQLKAAKQWNRCRPKKYMPSDINRKPPPYNVEPQFYDGRPEEYARAGVRFLAAFGGRKTSDGAAGRVEVVISEGSDDFDKDAHLAKVLADLAAQEDYDNVDEAAEAEILAAVKYPDPAHAVVAMAK